MQGPLSLTSSHLATGEVRALNANGLKLYDDGGNGIFVKDGGNVGIGTTTPEQRLHVEGPDASVIVHNTDAGGSKIRLLVFDSASPTGNGGFSIYDVDNAAHRLTISGAGRVGIVDSSPSYIFDVQQGSATDPHADAWETHSSRKFKEDIVEVGIAPDFNIKTYQYHIKKKDGKIDPDQKLHFGVVAEEVPEIIRGDSGKDIDLGAYITYVYALTKGLKLEISQLQGQVTTLEDRIAVLEGGAKK